MTGKLLRDARGIVALEFAFVAPAALALMVGGSAVGLRVIQAQQLDRAMLAGGYAAKVDAASAAVVAAVRSASPMTADATISATLADGVWTIRASVPPVMTFPGIIGERDAVATTFTVPAHN
jgi:hypothetical protein